MTITCKFARSSAIALLLLTSTSRSFLVRPPHFIANNIQLSTIPPLYHPIAVPQNIVSLGRSSLRSKLLYIMSRRSSRVAATATSAKISEAEGEMGEGAKEEGVNLKMNSPLKGALKKSNSDAEIAKKKKRASPAKKNTAAASVTANDDDNKTSPNKKSSKNKRASKGAAKSSDGSDTEEAKPAKKKAKAADHQRWTERTSLTRHWDPKKASESGSYTFTVISWNVAGLRTFIKKNPDVFANLAATYDADVICLQETKLQEDNLVDPKLKLNEYFNEKLEGYDCHFSCSVEKKGYSGTAMFIKTYGENAKKGKKQATLGSFFTKNKDGAVAESTPESNQSKSALPVSNLLPVAVTKELGIPAHDGEGRTITAEFPLFYLTNVYVPNSGQKLDRLSYRTTQWDKDFLARMKQLEQDGGKPIIWLGDLNVAYDEKDTWNEGAKHLAKSAGTTPEERASFSHQLSAGFVDAFRHLHPDGKGHYSYWSQRAGNREPNKGLRLDYFICSQELMTDENNKKVIVRDSYMLPDQLGSDHCPIILDIEIKGE